MFFFQECVSGPGLHWVRPPPPGSSAQLPPGEEWVCSQFVLTFRLNTGAGDPAARLGVTVAKPGKSKPQLPDLSKSKTQEENRHEVTPRAHASVAWSRQSAAGRRGLRGVPSFTLSSPTAGRPKRSTQMMPQAPRQPLFTLHLRNLSAEECAVPSAAGAGWLCLRPVQDTPPASSSPSTSSRGCREHPGIPRDAAGSRHEVGAQREQVGNRDSLLRACCEPVGAEPSPGDWVPTMALGANHCFPC